MKWLRWAGWVLIFAAVVSLSYDFYRFARVGFANYRLSFAWDYQDHPGTEGIIVLTGDRTRIPKSFELLKRRKSEWLLISGAGRGITLTEVVNQQGDSANSIHELWERIILESRSTTTIENGLESTEIIQTRKPNRVILVTSDYHMPRAATIFRDLMPQTEILEFPVSSGLMGPHFISERLPRLLWILGLEYWKYRLYLTHRSLDPTYPNTKRRP
ncbi:MAG: YdcF family protein [Deltaproteobacteria bacterium]|nr:YdcF family protein [Deltaproteobacteria bacterium]MBI3294463.1 YdcF family protein [Deltaproteobacteria bacterium]